MIPPRIVITGATGGIGRALVREYAEPGVGFLLLGRDPERLDAACRDAKSAGATARSANLSATDFGATAEVLQKFDEEGSVDLLLLAAGVKVGNIDAIEPVDQLDRVLNVNLSATIHNVQALLPEMRGRGRGQIALFSSAAALSPHADLLSYSATKAGIRGYGTALRRALRGTGVTVHLITPGFVDTPMTDRQVGWTPLKISADRAARIIRRGLLRNRPTISFPVMLFFLIRIENMLPTSLADWIDRAYRAKILPDEDELKAAGSENKSGTGPY